MEDRPSLDTPEERIWTALKRIKELKEEINALHPRIKKDLARRISDEGRFSLLPIREGVFLKVGILRTDAVIEDTFGIYLGVVDDGGRSVRGEEELADKICALIKESAPKSFSQKVEELVQRMSAWESEMRELVRSEIERLEEIYQGEAFKAIEAKVPESEREELKAEGDVWDYRKKVTVRAIQKTLEDMHSSLTERYYLNQPLLVREMMRRKLPGLKEMLSDVVSPDPHMNVVLQLDKTRYHEPVEPRFTVNGHNFTMMGQYMTTSHVETPYYLYRGLELHDPEKCQRFFEFTELWTRIAKRLLQQIEDDVADWRYRASFKAIEERVPPEVRREWAGEAGTEYVQKVVTHALRGALENLAEVEEELRNLPKVVREWVVVDLGELQKKVAQKVEPSSWFNSNRFRLDIQAEDRNYFGWPPNVRFLFWEFGSRRIRHDVSEIHEGDELPQLILENISFLSPRNILNVIEGLEKIAELTREFVGKIEARLESQFDPEKATDGPSRYLSKFFQELEAKLPPEERERLKERGVWEYREAVIANAFKEAFRELKGAEEYLSEFPPEIRRNVAFRTNMRHLTPDLLIGAGLDPSGAIHIHIKKHRYTLDEAEETPLVFMGEEKFAHLIRDSLKGLDLGKVHFSLKYTQELVQAIMAMIEEELRGPEEVEEEQEVEDNDCDDCEEEKDDYDLGIL